jgi:hypothetical protein
VVIVPQIVLIEAVTALLETAVIVSPRQRVMITTTGIDLITMPKVVATAAVGTEVIVGPGIVAVVIMGLEGLLVVVPHVLANELRQRVVHFRIWIGQAVKVERARNRLKGQ